MHSDGIGNKNLWLEWTIPVLWDVNKDGTLITTGTVFGGEGQLHKIMIRNRYLMTTTIAYGDFQYQNRIQLPNLGKEMIIGNAYITAYINSNVVIEGGIVLVKSDDIVNQRPDYNIDRWRECEKPKGWEYFWSVTNPDEIAGIQSAKKKANEAKFECLKDIYQRSAKRERQLDNLLE